MLLCQYLGHSKTAHHHLYIYPDGERFDELPAFAIAERANSDASLTAHNKYGAPQAGWGVNCAQFFAPQANDSGWDELWYSNTCYMQSSGEVLEIDNCDLKATSILPHASNNTYYFPRNVSFSISCSSSELSLFQWQSAGYDRGSVQQSAPSLRAIINSARIVLGMTASEESLAG